MAPRVRIQHGEAAFHFTAAEMRSCEMILSTLAMFHLLAAHITFKHYIYSYSVIKYYIYALWIEFKWLLAVL